MLLESIDKLEEQIKSFPPSFGLVKQELLNSIIKIKQEYKALQDRSITWGVDDFEARAGEIKGPNWKDFYDEDKFQEALEDMISNHDANNGINWDTIDYYLYDICRLEK